MSLDLNLIFAVCFVDGIDGKQARRTGCTGPLGELFDHGLDSWATYFMPIGNLLKYSFTYFIGSVG